MMIWIIDDDAAILDLVAKTLEAMGCETRGYADPSQIDDWDGAPDGIIIDWHLEHGTCEQAISQLRGRFPLAKLMLITADTDLDVLQRAMNLGVCGWWYKPSGPINLRAQAYNAFNLAARRCA